MMIPVDRAEGRSIRPDASHAGVTVIMPCFNVEEWVGKAVASVFAQEHRPIELVVIDDGSTDGTLSLLRSLASNAPVPMQVIAMPNSGAGAARNAGVAASRGQYIQFLDADDVLGPGKIARQVALATASGADVVIGAYRELEHDGRLRGVVPPWPGDPWEGLIRTRLGTTSANLFSRQAVQDAGGWDQSLRSSQDYELLFRMLKRGAAVVNDELCGCDVLKRERGAISRTDEPENWKRYLALRCAIRDHARGMGEKQSPLVALADQYLFNAIRVLSAHDRKAAFTAFEQMMPMGFAPRIDQATTSRYALVYRLLGFRNAERLAALMKQR